MYLRYFICFLFFASTDILQFKNDLEQSKISRISSDILWLKNFLLDINF